MSSTMNTDPLDAPLTPVVVNVTPTTPLTQLTINATSSQPTVATVQLDLDVPHAFDTFSVVLWYTTTNNLVFSHYHTNGASVVSTATEPYTTNIPATK